MWKKTTLAGAGALAVVIVIAGCSSSDSGSEHPAEHSASVSAIASPTTPSAEAHNDADVMFAQHMIPHHPQAVEMSDALRQAGHRP